MYQLFAHVTINQSFWQCVSYRQHMYQSLALSYAVAVFAGNLTLSMFTMWFRSQHLNPRLNEILLILLMLSIFFLKLQLSSSLTLRCTCLNRVLFLVFICFCLLINHDTSFLPYAFSRSCLKKYCKAVEHYFSRPKTDFSSGNTIYKKIKIWNDVVYLSNKAGLLTQCVRLNV